MGYVAASYGHAAALHAGQREPLNGSRIAAYALVAVIHLVALGLLARSGADDPLPRFLEGISRPPVFADVASHPVPPPTRDASIAGETATAPASVHRDLFAPVSRAPVPVVAESSPNAPERADQLPAGDSGTSVIANDGADGTGIAGSSGGTTGNGAGVGTMTLRKLRPIRTPAPDYPPHALDFSEEGVVVLLVKVGVNGRPLEATVLKSSGFDDLDQAMRRQVMSEWRFAPATENGHPIEAFTLAKQRFVLNDPM